MHTTSRKALRKSSTANTAYLKELNYNVAGQLLSNSGNMHSTVILKVRK